MLVLTEQAKDVIKGIVEEVGPDPAWAQTYARMQPTFDRLYAHSQALYDDLDALAAAP